jgi:hypothetical protein
LKHLDSDDALLMDGAEELVNLVLEDKEQEILIKEAFQKVA